VTRAPVKLAVLGDPLAFTRSPELHRAGLASLGIAGTSDAIRTAPDRLGARFAELAAAGYLGVNLTMPLKEPALAHLARVSDDARRARSVNTVGFTADGAWGDTTDGPGFVDLLRSLGREPGAERAVLLGGGGGSRCVALALEAAGAAGMVVCARRLADAEPAWSDLPVARTVGWRSDEELDALARATLVVNATPLSGDQEPAPLEAIAGDALILDLVYGEHVTPWVLRARAEGRNAYDGLGLLVFQARRSLALWLARPVALDPLARAVGWPR
jgi:shikimate dehydrogenase